MKLLRMSLVFIFTFSSLNAALSDHFITTWDTTIPSGEVNDTTLKLDIMDPAYTYNFRVDWNNDGDFDDIYSDGVAESTYYTNTQPISHTYDTAGTYSIGIDGEFPRFKTYGGSSLRAGASKLIAVEQWGTQVWQNFSYSFGRSNLVRTSTIDTPDLSQVTDMSYMFYLSTKLTDLDTTDWNTTNVTNMKGLFNYARVANPDVSNWDVSNVTDMSSLFNEARVATPNVSNWDVSKVTNMSAMFRYAYKANPDVSTWNTSNVTIMERMFQQAYKATPDTSDWNTSKVTDMYFMFNRAILATPDTSNWNTSSVTRADRMFDGASVATPDTSHWDTSNIKSFYRMFYGARKANPNTSNWDTSNVTSMTLMFYDAPLANPNTSHWQTSKVTEMRQMFHKATSARPVVDSWDISNVTNMTNMFESVTLPTDIYDAILLHFGSEILKKDNLSFSGGNSQYCEGVEARQSLLSNNSWTITDSGQNCFPDAPLFLPDLIDASDLGNNNSDNKTNDNTPTFDVNFYSNVPSANTVIGTHLCSEVGIFALETNTTLADGTYDITYTESRRGDESVSSDALSIEIYTQVPVLTITTPIMIDNTINSSEESNVTISGNTTAEANQTVTIVVGNINTTATVQADGSWSVSNIDLSTEAEGSLIITANISDIAGNKAVEITQSITKESIVNIVTTPLTNITSPIVSVGVSTPTMTNPLTDSKAPITSPIEEIDNNRDINEYWYQYREDTQTSSYCHLEQNTTISSDIDVDIETLEEDNRVTIQYEYEPYVDIIDNNINTQCELVEYKAYLNVYKIGRLQTGYIKKFLNCESLIDSTLEENSFFWEGSKAQLKYTSDNEKEAYDNSSMVIIIDTKLNENSIITGEL